MTIWQYVDGLAGPLLVYGPSSGNWDLIPDPILVADWVHPPADTEYANEKSISRGLARTDSIVVNGNPP